MADADFSFAFEGAESPGGPFGHLQVVRFEGKEALSALYRYEVTAIAKAPAAELDPRDLVGKAATLRIATQSTPSWKVVHGIVTRADEIDEAPEGMLYRLVVMPPWARAAHEKRCRVFVDKTLRQIVDAVLGGDPRMQLAEGAEAPEDDGSPDYAPAEERYTWRIADPSRIDDLRVRPFVVQYNESDLDFVQRLLEDEGIAYHFENGKGTCLLVLADHDGGRARLGPDEVLGPGKDGREVKALKLGARLRPGRVVLDDYNWKKPGLGMEAEAEDGPGSDLVEYHFPGGYPDAPEQGKPLASARADRYRVEASYALGEGSVRVLSAGSIFRLEHQDATREGEYLVTGLAVRGEQTGVVSLPSDGPAEPFSARFELARRGAGKDAAESRFRPALRTRKPRIGGTQTAVVTADPGASGAEVNVGGPDGLGVGCARLRFRWDRDETRLAKEPSSAWVRVSQIFAGAGQGAVWHPRVGDEVLVDFEGGDPDRPLVTGRVYNGQNLPPRQKPPESTMKSLSTPGGATYNEIAFDDAAGGEVLHYHAGKNQTTDVASFRREGISSSAAMLVGGSNTETIGANRSETIGGNDTLTVGGAQAITIGANSTTVFGASSDKKVGANEVNIVGGSQTIAIGASLTEAVGGAVVENYGATRTTLVAGAVSETIGGPATITVGGDVDEKCATHDVSVGASRLMMVGGNYLTTVQGDVTLNVASVSILSSGGPQDNDAGGGILRRSPVHFTTSPNKYDLRELHTDAQGSFSENFIVSVTAIGRSMELFGAKKSTTILQAGVIGVHARKLGAEIKVWGLGFVPSGVDIQGAGALLEI